MGFTSAFRMFQGTNAGYALTNSVQFDNSSNEWFYKSDLSASNQQKAIWSVWIKRTAGIELRRDIFSAGTYPNYYDCNFDNQDRISMAGAGVWTAYTDNSFSSQSTWYHIVVRIDTTASSGDRVKVWVNGSLQSLSHESGYATEPSLNSNLYLGNNGTKHIIGTYNDQASTALDGKLADFNLVFGQGTLDYSDFASGNTPKEFTGYSDGGDVHLKFDDTSDLGNDTSGNNNDWSLNNISSADASTDVPS